MSSGKETPEGKAPIGPWLFVFGVLLVLGLGYLGMRNLFSGVTLKPPPIVGEWQAYRSPWRFTFNPDKSVVSTTDASGADDPESKAPVSGTYSIDYFGTLWVKLDNGKVYTATLRSDLPHQFDVVDSATDVVTVFERVRRLPSFPDEVPKASPDQ